MNEQASVPPWCHLLSCLHLLGEVSPPFVHGGPEGFVYQIHPCKLSRCLLRLGCGTRGWNIAEQTGISEGNVTTCCSLVGRSWVVTVEFSTWKNEVSLGIPEERLPLLDSRGTWRGWFPRWFSSTEPAFRV